MKRRKFIKALSLSGIASTLPFSSFSSHLFSTIAFPKPLQFSDDWQNWPTMKWVGPNYWGNRLQDWELKDGKVICNVTGSNRNLHLLTVQSNEDNTAFTTSVHINLLNKSLPTDKETVLGITLGAKGPFNDYRSAAVFGKGLIVGINNKGQIQVDKETYDTSLTKIPSSFDLIITMKKLGRVAELNIEIDDKETGTKISILHDVKSSKIIGNFALIAHCNQRSNEVNPLAAFSNWTISGPDMIEMATQTFGPICFAQYTLHNNTIKLTAQLAPIESIRNHKVVLELKKGNNWQEIANHQLDEYARTVNFRIENWTEKNDVPYRIRLDLPLNDGLYQTYYDGTIAKEPINDEEVKVAVFSCNADHGFPDTDVYQNVGGLEPDIILFLGDQFYEGTGGFSVDYGASYDKTSLDYLRKWYMFGWSYRNLFRHKPCAIIPDDHDVWHGNVWGEAGKKADTTNGFGYVAQDSGGYKMPADFVNMVQQTQTSHLPDAFDPTPVKQGIGVYYTNWNYGGLSFALLEDRKFKDAPKNVLPPEAEVKNGWIQSDTFDIKKYRELDAVLLGERQLDFLEDWSKNWHKSTDMKVVLSQTNFATVATLPKGEKIDEIVPRLPIPPKGEYVKGDAPTSDMDSNGWPQKGRDNALKIIRKAHAFHIAGDQHLASFIQYGVDEFGDSGYAFAGPALNNIWPRRYWPDIDSSNHSYENPAYLGNHLDGFGNKMTIKAVANPYETNLEPKIIHNRSTGYGLVTFNKKTGDIKSECWDRFVNPKNDRNNQKSGWPITINQMDNYGRKAEAFLPTLNLTGIERPLVSVFDESGNHIYTVRVIDNQFQPKVFKNGKYQVTIKDSTGSVVLELKKEKAKKSNTKSINI